MNAYQKKLKELGLQIADGTNSLTAKDVAEIAQALDFTSFKDDFLPKANLADKSPKNSKHYSMVYICQLFKGMTPEKLMKLETGWLKQAHKISGSSKNDEKDVPADLVTPQIISRIIALAYFLHNLEIGKIKVSKSAADWMVRKSLVGINVFLVNPTLKGDVRMTKVKVGKKWVNAYDFFMKNGVLVGYYGKFLPNPQVSLPYIFSLFHRDALRPEVYKK